MADLFGTYPKRIKFTVDHTKIDADVTWFPVTVHLTAAQGEEVFAEFDADEDFDRIAFTTSDGETQLYAECELFNWSESKAIYHVSKTGWVLDNDVDTDFYMYYDNTADHNTTYISMSGGTPAQSVWDSNFKAVYHIAGTGENAIDVGAGATNRAASRAGNITYIDYNNPVNYTGRLTSFQIYPDTYTMASCYAVVFREISSGYFTAIAVSANFGTVTAGLKTFSVNLPVQVGDFLGVYFTNNGDFIDTDISGYAGVYYLAGDQTACVNTQFTLLANNAISIYGIGVEANTILDSTSNNNDGTKKGANEPAQAAGLVGYGQDFDGIDDKIITYGAYNDNGFTISLFLKPSDITTTIFITNGQKTATPDNKRCVIVGAQDNYFNIYNNAYPTGTATDTQIAATINTWQYITYGSDGTNVLGYKDGVGIVNVIANLNCSEMDRYYLGQNSVGSVFYSGLMDEVRISNVLRSAAWDAATNDSLRDTLLTYGDEETAGWTHKLNGATISKYNGSAFTKWNGVA